MAKPRACMSVKNDESPSRKEYGSLKSCGSKCNTMKMNHRITFQDEGYFGRAKKVIPIGLRYTHRIESTTCNLNLDITSPLSPLVIMCTFKVVK